MDKSDEISLCVGINDMEVDAGNAALSALETQITELESAVARTPQDAASYVALANALLTASKAYQKAGKSHESAVYQARSYDAFARASELDAAIAHTQGVQGALCTFQAPPTNTASFRLLDDDEKDVDDKMDDESSESSSNEDDAFDQEQYFYQMAKRQYMEELAKNPHNEKVRRRLAELRREHGDDDSDEGDTTGSGIFGKKRRMK